MLMLDKSVVNAGKSMNKIHAKLSLAKVNETVKGIDWTIQAIAENHLVGSEIPTSELVRIKEVVSKNWKF